ncbi:hypothetical protein [Streptosporangium sp. NPDC048865]|uniref:hypothetical protein n=1 Tax=Streptosporangium sp. NPDC048865 TaxID=3155766 RepID=UPI00343129A5
MVAPSKNVIPGTMRMGALLRVRKDAHGDGRGRHTAYAGPTRLPAKTRCVVRGGDLARAA